MINPVVTSRQTNNKKNQCPLLLSEGHWFNLVSKMQPEEKFTEYVDALVTVELALAMAVKYKEPVNKPVAQCARLVAMRCKDLANRQLFLGVSKDEYPAVLVYQFRTMLDEEISK